MSPAKKRAMIERDHPELSISQQCKLVRLSRSAFYYTSVGINADTLAMMKERLTGSSPNIRSSAVVRSLLIYEERAQLSGGIASDD